MMLSEAFVGLSKRCRWRAADIANGRCRFDSDEQHMVCALNECPAAVLGILPACLIPEMPRRKDMAVAATVVPTKKKGRKTKQDPLEAVINMVAGLTGFVPDEEE